MAVVAVLLLVLPMLMYVFAEGKHSLGGNRLDHLLGRTEQVTAQVDSVQTVGYCGRKSQSREQFRIELSWSAGPPPGHSAYLICNSAPVVGQSIPAWVDSGGYVQLESPTEVRLGMGAIGLGLGLLTVGTGAAMLVPARRQRQRLLAAADTPLLPPVPVIAGRNASRRRGFGFRPAPQSAGLAPPMWAIAILYAAPGHSPKITSTRQVKGAWHFRAGLVLESGRQLGVLERGQERCWVEARPLR